MLTGIPLRMPKSKQKGKRREGIAQSDDDFDDMLAELRTADLTDRASNTSSSSSSSRNTTTTASSITSTIVASVAIEVPEQRIIGAIKRGDIAQLRRWARRGLRVTSGLPLLQAASLGNLGIAQCLVQELGADVNQADGENCTPLCFAAGKGSLAMVRCLVKELGASVNETNQEGATPVYIAAQEGNLAVVRCLIEELGADVNQSTLEGATPMEIAAYKGHLELLRFLVLELHAGINQRNPEGATFPYIAAQEGNLAKARVLVKELGADINKAALNGSTPLMAAAVKKHTDVVKWLIKAGADTQASLEYEGTRYTAANASREVDAPADQTAYLEAKTHCSSPCCSGAGLLKCTGCRQARYCGETCQLAHWKVHKVDCKVGGGARSWRRALGIRGSDGESHHRVKI